MTSSHATSGRPMDENLYETDFVGWTDEQAHLLRSGQVGLADIANIAEEIETLGRSEARALKSCYRLIAMHLLKAIYQPEKATRSWDSTITEQRLTLRDVLDENPGLKPKRASTFAAAYADARKQAVAETGLRLTIFPEEPPFGIDDVERDDWLPDALGQLRSG